MDHGLGSLQTSAPVSHYRYAQATDGLISVAPHTIEFSRSPRAGATVGFLQPQSQEPRVGHHRRVALASGRHVRLAPKRLRCPRVDRLVPIGYAASAEPLASWDGPHKRDSRPLALLRRSLVLRVELVLRASQGRPWLNAIPVGGRNNAGLAPRLLACLSCLPC